MVRLTDRPDMILDVYRGRKTTKQQQQQQQILKPITVGVIIDNKPKLVLSTNILQEVSMFFSYLWDRICPIFSGAGKFCLSHGLGQLTGLVKSNVRTLYLRSDVILARVGRKTLRN